MKGQQFVAEPEFWRLLVKILKVIFGSTGTLLLLASLWAVMADSERLNKSATVLALSSQVLLLSALVIHTSEKRKMS